MHLLAAAQEAGVNFDMVMIDTLSRKIPQLCKVAPSTPLYHMEDVHRAGGVMAILGELARGGLLHLDCPTVHSTSLGEALSHWDIMQTEEEDVRTPMRRVAGIPTSKLSQDLRWPSLDTDREGGCADGARLLAGRGSTVLLATRGAGPRC